VNAGSLGRVGVCLFWLKIMARVTLGLTISQTNMGGTKLDGHPPALKLLAPLSILLSPELLHYPPESKRVGSWLRNLGAQETNFRCVKAATPNRPKDGVRV
jgi:hypothetical protein